MVSLSDKLETGTSIYGVTNKFIIKEDIKTAIQELVNQFPLGLVQVDVVELRKEIVNIFGQELCE